jgi:hypothetical protein
MFAYPRIRKHPGTVNVEGCDPMQQIASILPYWKKPAIDYVCI